MRMRMMRDRSEEVAHAEGPESGRGEREHDLRDVGQPLVCEVLKVKWNAHRGHRVEHKVRHEGNSNERIHHEKDSLRSCPR